MAHIPIIIFRGIISIIILTLMGCNETANVLRLREAEGIMEQRPDSSLKILDLIESDKLIGKNKARYALLYSQALDKNYIDVDDDSLIRIAVDYYRDDSDLYSRMLSCYYMARVCQNVRDYPKGIVYAEKAKNIAKDLNDDFYLGLIYRCIADINNSTYNSSQELENCKSSYQYFYKSKRKLYQLYALESIAIAYANNRMYDNCINICDSVLMITTDTSLIVDCMRVAVDAYMNQQKYEQAKSLLLDVKKFAGDSYTAVDCANMAEIYAFEGKNDSAFVFIEDAKNLSATLRDSIAIYRAYYEFYNYNKAFDKALFNINMLHHMQDSLLKISVKESAAIAQRDFYIEETNINKNRIERIHRIYLFSAVILFLIIGGVIFYFFHKDYRNKVVLEQKTEIAKELSAIVGKKETQLLHLQDGLKKRMREYYSTVDRLCATYSNVANTKKKQDVIDEVTKIIDSLRSSKTISILEQQINEYYDELLIKLKKEIPRLSRKEYELYIYLCLGFSAATISFLINTGIDNVYVKKARLKAKIRRSSPPNTSIFLHYIE